MKPYFGQSLVHLKTQLTDINSDPWWIFTTINLFWNIKRRYEFGLLELIKVSPRFAILLLCMILSLGFIILDCLSVTSVLKDALPDGLNPFWKLAFVFKCFTDTIILDDFKTALDKLKEYRLGRIGASGMNGSDTDARAPMTSRRPTEYAPWNESRGITSEDRQERQEVESMDLESQLQYWIRRDGSPSTVK
jgi:hypothetical protein